MPLNTEKTHLLVDISSETATNPQKEPTRNYVHIVSGVAVMIGFILFVSTCASTGVKLRSTTPTTNLAAYDGIDFEGKTYKLVVTHHLALISLILHHIALTGKAPWGIYQAKDYDGILLQEARGNGRNAITRFITKKTSNDLDKGATASIETLFGGTSSYIIWYLI